MVEAEETVEFAFLHMHKTLRTRLLVTLVRYPPNVPFPNKRPAVLQRSACA